MLDDPTKNPGHYRYDAKAYGPTIAPHSTVGVSSCPSNEDDGSVPRSCEMGSRYWVSKADPLDPVDCRTRKALPGEIPDDQGNVIVCEDCKRHPRKSP